MKFRHPKVIIPALAVFSLWLIFAVYRATLSSESDLIGDYKIKSPYCSSHISLKSNGRFNQNLRLNSGQTISATGTWALNHEGNEIKIKKLVSANQDSRTRKIYINRGDSHLTIWKIPFISMKLIEDDDSNIFYEKTDDN